MITVNVLLSGKLRLDGYGQDRPANDDDTLRLDLQERSTVHDVVQPLDVPPDQVTMAMVNGRKCVNGVALKPGDRVVLVPSDVAALWRFLGKQNLGMDSVFDS